MLALAKAIELATVSQPKERQPCATLMYAVFKAPCPWKGAARGTVCTSENKGSF